MNIQVLLFGITRDLVGENSIFLELTGSNSIKDLKEILILNHPSLKNVHEFAIAVNEDYVDDDLIIKEGDVVAIIPPVSGG